MTDKCLVIGDLNIDLIFRRFDRFPEIGSEILAGESFLDIGGSGGIFSAVLSQLGIETSIFSEIGNDLFGRFLIEKLKKFGVNTKLIKINNNEKTGITVTASYPDDKYQLSEINILNSMEQIKLKDDLIRGINHIHFTSYFMMRGLAPKYKEFIEVVKDINKNITFSLDTNDDPDDKWDGGLSDIIENIDILFLNEKEVLKISGSDNTEDALKKLEGAVEYLVVKLGPRGGIVSSSGETVRRKGITADFKDSTGAGDNFDAGFLFGYLNGMDQAVNLEIANICGSNSVESMGGVGEIERFDRLGRSIAKIIG